MNFDTLANFSVRELRLTLKRVEILTADIPLRLMLSLRRCFYISRPRRNVRLPARHSWTIELSLQKYWHSKAGRLPRFQPLLRSYHDNQKGSDWLKRFCGGRSQLPCATSDATSRATRFNPLSEVMNPSKGGKAHFYFKYFRANISSFG